MREYDFVKIVKSDRSGSDYYAVFKNKKTGRERKTYFGDSSMDHYTIHKDKQRRENYLSRHKRDLRTNDPTRKGFLSYYILWGPSTSIKANTAAYRKRFFGSSMKSPRGVKSPKPVDTGLSRWFAEKWTDEHGNVCGSSKNRTTKKCRPSKRITKKSPVTWNEMSPSQKSRAVAEKKQVGMGSRASPIRKRRKKVSSPMRNCDKKPSRVMYDDNVIGAGVGVRLLSPVKGKKAAAKTSPVAKSRGKPKPANPALYEKVKAEAMQKFDVWPSAYGSGWLVNEYKRRGGTYQ